MSNSLYGVHMHVSTPINGELPPNSGIVGMGFVTEFSVPVPDEISDPAEQFSIVFETVMDQVGPGDVIESVVITRLDFSPEVMN